MHKTVQKSSTWEVLVRWYRCVIGEATSLAKTPKAMIPQLIQLKLWRNFSRV